MTDTQQRVAAKAFAKKSGKTVDMKKATARFSGWSFSQRYLV